MMNLSDKLGSYVQGVTLEICRGINVSRPRVRPVDHFTETTRVEFPRRLREIFPIGTRYIATVKVCQKHNADGSKKGEPYLRAYNIALIPESVPDKGLIAQVKTGSISGLAYEYNWK